MNTTLQRLLTSRQSAFVERAGIVARVTAENREHLTSVETERFEELSDAIAGLDERIAETRENIERSGRHSAGAALVRRVQAHRGSDDGGPAEDWASRAATALTSMGGEHRAVTSGSIDVPSLVEPEVIAKARPDRLIDLIVNRKAIDSNAFEYYQQTVRTNNAAPVADGGLKPTSTLTVTPVTDRCRVVAHLSEPVPVRLMTDHDELVRWLDAEMRGGVLDALEDQFVGGDGTGENMTGLLAAAGTTAVAYAADLPTTLRKAVTAMQVIGEKPTAWVLNPADAEAVDLLRYQLTGAGEDPEAAAFLLDGYNQPNAGSGNVFGPSVRLVSPRVPAGTGLLADWSQVRVYVREDVRLDIDAAGDLFDRNQVKVRAEGRFGVAVLRPSAFAVVDLTP